MQRVEKYHEAVIICIVIVDLLDYCLITRTIK